MIYFFHGGLEPVSQQCQSSIATTSLFESGLQVTGFSATFFMSSSGFTPFFSFYFFNKSIVRADPETIFQRKMVDINQTLMRSLERSQRTSLEDLFLQRKLSQMKRTAGSSLKVPLFPVCEAPWEVCRYIRWQSRISWQCV